jgi:N-acetylmuramoyl-L-alanine amidase
MPTIHVVKQGECFSRIARRYGFVDYKKLYEHPDNAELRKKRPNPNVLFPGDQIAIPAPASTKSKAASAPTGQVHRFVLASPPRLVRLALKDAEGKPLANTPYTLTVEGEQVEGNTDGQGLLEQKVPYTATQALLECAGQSWQLELGHLNPMENTPDEGVSGAEARLINLGYALEPTGRMTPELRSAIRAFQHRSGLEVTGRLDGNTIKKLTELHGS